ncbi:MAG TPA: TAXI family TRAP transporter solute-binding subunit [Dermatophilaceae bacterium]|nr:TAXI family TRAP transporter solute-binding subunit [Dermatophilaceae bacterium]
MTPNTRRQTRRRRLTTAVTSLIVAGLALSACGGKQAQEPSAGGTGAGGAGSCEIASGQVTIATGNSTGVYFVLGGGIASMLSSKTPLKATAAETGASVQNIQQLVGGQYDIAFSLADTAADAVAGKGAFKEPQKVQALGRIHANYTQVVVRKAAGIKTVEDMRGKRISTGSPKSGTEVIATRLLKSAGLDINKDVQAQRLELGKTVDGMKDGSIDGFVWSGGLPTPALTDLFTSQKDAVDFVDVTPLLPKMKEINAVYAEGSIPAATYGLPSDVKTIVVPNVLLVGEDFPASNACGITKLLWENSAELAKVHPSGKEFTKENGPQTDPVPLHPGSKTAFDAM